MSLHPESGKGGEIMDLSLNKDNKNELINLSVLKLSPDFWNSVNYYEWYTALSRLNALTGG
jgi:hypothetical protein